MLKVNVSLPPTPPLCYHKHESRVALSLPCVLYDNDIPFEYILHLLTFQLPKLDLGLLNDS